MRRRERTRRRPAAASRHGRRRRTDGVVGLLSVPGGSRGLGPESRTCYILLELLQSGVVLVELAAQLTNTLLHLLVRFTLVLQHHFHKEKFALKEATLTHIGNC